MHPSRGKKKQNKNYTVESDENILGSYPLSTVKRLQILCSSLNRTNKVPIYSNVFINIINPITITKEFYYKYIFFIYY